MRRWEYAGNAIESARDARQDVHENDDTLCDDESPCEACIPLIEKIERNKETLPDWLLNMDEVLTAISNFFYDIKWYVTWPFWWVANKVRKD